MWAFFLIWVLLGLRIIDFTVLVAFIVAGVRPRLTVMARGSYRRALVRLLICS